MTVLITLLVIAALVFYAIATSARDLYHARAALELACLCAMGALIACALVALGR